MDTKLPDIFNRFHVDGTAMDIKPFGNGHINRTFLVKTDVKDYMLQTVNDYVFRNVDSLMRNIYIVTNHLREKGRTTLHVRKTNDNRIYVNDNGTYYRLYTYIGDSVCYEKIDSLELVEKTAVAFGRFHADLSDLDPILIAETIPDFHNTPKRYNDFMEAVKQDEAGRLADCLPEMGFIVKNKKRFSAIMDALNAGRIPYRIVHNDPKINNVLFTGDGEEVKCVIDLDTVMPGSCLFDFGDAVRSLFTGDNESALEPDALVYDEEIFRAYTRGYISATRDSLLPDELRLLPDAVFTLAVELGMRFLEDHLNGDKYFGINFENENYYRARNQLHLAEDILSHMDGMRAIVAEYM